MGRSAQRVAVAALAVAVALVGLAGCGRFGDSAADQTELTWEEQALEEVGYTSEQLGLVGEDTTAAPGDRRAKHPRLRFAFRHTLHGEAVIQTPEGTKTVVVQRGEVTEVNATSITVKSTDGFVLTWTFGDPLTVVKERKKTDASALAVGQQVGVAGAKEGSTVTARLIVVPRTK